MKAYLVLLLAVVVAASLSEECEYVDSQFILNDIDSVKKCYHSYRIESSDQVVQAITTSLDVIEQMYPYIEIASHPPGPAGYFKVHNFTSGLEELKAALKDSDGLVSKIYPPTVKFINGFRDGHFSISIKESRVFENIFVDVIGIFPFVWNPVVENGETHVFLSPNPFSDSFIPNGEAVLQAKVDSGVYASTVDGKDALDFFANFFGDYNSMKSRQGTLFLSMYQTNNGFSFLENPVDDAFEPHTIVFSDGSEIAFTLAFYNSNNMVGTREDVFKPKNLKFEDSTELEKEVIDIIKNIDRLKREKRDSHVYVECGMIGGMNYISIPTFAPEVNVMFIMELLECVEDFDENDRPITIILPFNGGGNAALRELVQFLLMPGSDSRTIRAARKTPTTRYIAIDNAGVSMVDPDTCESLSNYEIAQFWKDDEQDDFGDGVIHTRTKKFIESYASFFFPVAKYALKKHVRKPTEIVVATDGFCFSACSFFVNNIIRDGSAIVAGYGVTMPGDELFAAGQCPSRVISPTSFFGELNDVDDVLGLHFQGTFLESYNYSEKMKEIIPGDFDILRIDTHTGYYVNNKPVFSDLLEHTTAVYENFKTKCNPANKHLLMVTDKCHSKDPNALYSGYVCNSKGEWDEKTCKISSCKPGYLVDFDRNKCVPNPCDPRSMKPVPSSVSASDGLYPMIAVVVAALTVVVHRIF